MWGKWEISVCSMRGEIDAYLTDYNWAAALANISSNTGNSEFPTIGFLGDGLRFEACPGRV